MAQGGFGQAAFGAAASSSNLGRDELLEMAYRKIGISMTDTLKERGIDILNLIIREEDAKQTGSNKSLWALGYAGLFLTDNGLIYSSNEGLEPAIFELVQVSYRNTSGDDTELEIIDAQQYGRIVDKNAVGDPLKVFLSQDISFSDRLLYVYPSLADTGTTSEVLGSDGNNYSCIMGHTSSTQNYPITGQDWRAYWAEAGSSGATWAADTEYTNGALIRYIYKRPLYDFTAEDDEPDMPQAWTRYLVYRLAHDLCPDQDIDMESRAWLKGEYLQAYADLFNSARPVQTNPYNKVLYY